VHFKKIPTQEIKEDLINENIKFVSFLPENTYIASIPQNFKKAKLFKYDISHVQRIPSKVKYDPKIFESPLPEWAFKNENINIAITLMKDADIGHILNFLKNKQSTILEINEPVKIIRAAFPRSSLMDLIKIPTVNYVSLISEPGEPEDLFGRCLHRSNTINTHYNEGRHFDGEGVSIGVNDDGYVGPHIDFQGRTEQRTVENDLTGDHGDMVAGILAGAGNLNPKYEGMAKGAKIHVRQYSSSLPGSVQLHNDSGVMLFSSSYGNGCNGGYTSLCRQVDQEIRLNPSLIQVFSCGNSGNQNCGYGAGAGWGNITGGHKQGKNVIATANLNYNGSLVTSSSRGPATDGRIKPDLAAHGNGQISTDPNNTYGAGSGTSAAAPGISGVLAQLYQAFRSLNNGTDPTSSLLKACMLNTAEDYGNTGPDFSYGWGRVNAYRAVKVLEEKRYIDTVITQGNLQNFNIDIPSGVKEARIMIYWLDYEGNPSSSKALVNDLDLTISNSSNVFYPWVLNPTANASLISAPATTGTDHLNNMEQVTLFEPSSGIYTINVEGYSIPQGPQKYHIVYEFLKDEITVTYPIGGEGILPNKTEYINWDAIGDDGLFNIEYSIDSGASWENIGSVGGQIRMKNWYVPSEFSSDGIVRVTRQNISDISDHTFAIIDDPNNIKVDSVCFCNVSVSWDSVPGAAAYEVLVLGEKYMDSIGTTTNNYFSIPVDSPSGGFWYTVRAITNKGCKGQRAIAQYYDGSGQVSCSINADFQTTINKICIGEAVEIEDLSSGCPSNWEWSFLPNNPTFLNGTNNFSKNPLISFNETGSYTITLTSSNSFGSQSVTKTNFVNIIGEKDIEITEDFESNNFPPSDWRLQNIDQDITWKDTMVIGINGEFNNVMMIDNINNEIGNYDRLISFPLKLSNNLSNPYLFFDISYSDIKNFNDELTIEISEDCGKNFIDTVYYKNGSNLSTNSNSTLPWLPTQSSHWRRESISLYKHKGKVVSLGFTNKSGEGNNIFIDNINVKDLVSEEYDPLSFLLFPNPNYGTFTIQMENFDLEKINIKIVDATGKLIKEDNINFKSNSSKTIEFKSNLLAKGYYFIEISDGEKSKLKSFIII